MKKKHLHLWQEIYIPHIKCFYTHLRYRVKPQNVRTNTSLTPGELKGKALSTTAYHFSTNRLKIPANTRLSRLRPQFSVQKVDNAIYCIQWKTQLVSLSLDHWIPIYPVDSAFQHMNNRCVLSKPLLISLKLTLTSVSKLLACQMQR